MPRSILEIRKANGGLGNLSDEDIVQNTYSDFSSYYKSQDEYAKAIGYGGAGRGLTSSRISAGVDDYQSNLYGVVGAVSRAAGAPAGVAEWADRGRDRNKQAAGYAQQRSKELGGVDDWREIDGVGSAANYLGGLAAQSLPYAGEAIVGGLTGGAGFAGTAARMGLTGAAARTAARTAGATVASYPSAVGDILSNQRDQNGGEDLGMAAAGGVPYALLNAGLGVEGRLAQGALARNSVRALDDLQGVGGYAARTAATAGKVALGEGASETGQELINQRFGRMAVDDNETLFNPEANKRYVDSFVGGAALGGAFGTIGGGRRSQGFAPTQPGASEDLLATQQESPLPAKPGLPQLGFSGYDTGVGEIVAMADGSAMLRSDYNKMIRGEQLSDGSMPYIEPLSSEMFVPRGERYQHDPDNGVPYETPETPEGTGIRPSQLQMPVGAPGAQTDAFNPPLMEGPNDVSRPAAPEAPFALQPPGNMQDGNQRELNLQPPMPGPQAPQLPRGNQKGITQQMPFSGNTRSPQGQVLQGFVDSLAEEGYLDEGSYVQVATLIAQGKFAMVQKAVNEAVKNKAAAEKMVEQAAKIAEKQIAAEESANASTPATPTAPSAPAAAPNGRNRRAPNTGAVAGAVQPAAPAAPVVQPGQQGRPAVPAGGQPVPPVAATPAAQKPEVDPALIELRKRQSVLTSIRNCLAGT